MVFLDMLTLLTTWGGMAYYLVLLFSIWSIVGLALARWSRGERRGVVPRLLIAGGIISFARFALFCVALIGQQNDTSLVALAPPLERLVDALSAVLICWAFVAPNRYHAFSRVMVGLLGLFFVGFYVIAAVQWNATWQQDTLISYNLFWQRWVWELTQFGLLALVLAYLFAVPIAERGTLIVGLGMLAVAHLAQAVFPFADQVPHFAGWVRLANLVVFPLLAVIAFRLIVQRFDLQATELQAMSHDSLSQVTGLMDLVDMNRKMASFVDLDAVLENAVRSVSQIVPSDLCALAFSNAQRSDEMELAVVYRSHEIDDTHGRFLVSDYPAIQYAILRSKPVILQGSENDQVVGVYQLLAGQDTEIQGPLIVQPLGNELSVDGVILVCRPGQSEPFSAAEIHKCETLSRHIAVSVSSARRYRELESKKEQLTADLRLLEVEHSRTKADLENRLQQSQNEMSLYIQKLYETEVSEQRAQNDARELREQFKRHKKGEQTEQEQIKEELEQSIKRVGFLTQKVGQLDATRVQLNRRMEALQKEKAALESQLAMVLEERNTLRVLEERRHAALKREGTLGLEDVSLEWSCPAILCDRSGHIIRLNATAARLLGDGQEWVGKLAFELWPDERWQSALHAVTDQYAESRGLVPLVMEYHQKPLEVILAAVRLGDQHVGALIALHDVPQMDEQIQARDEFLASLAHELRTPMTSIVGYTELLLNESVGGLQDLQRKFLQRVQANIERMGGMLNDLIGVTTIDSGKLAIDLDVVDIAQVLDNALHKVRFRLDEKEIETEVSASELPTLYADPESVQQIVDNLLTNACKSSQEGSTIRIQAQLQDDDPAKSYLHLAISDTGGGILPQDRARVFDRFYRADDTLITGLGETGVGLSIVKALVEAQYGRVWIESDVGVGTTFHVTIPFGLEKKVGTGKNTLPVARGESGHG